MNPVVPALAALAAGAMAAGCFVWPATVDLSYAPVRAHDLDAAGIHELRFAVRVFDRRAIGDPRDVGRRAGPQLRPPPVRSTRDAAEVVRIALSEELRSHDLRVTPVERADVLLEVDLTDLYVLAEQKGRGPLQGGEVEGHVGGRVRVIDPRSGRTLFDLPLAERDEVHSLLLTARKYEWALNAALGRFARRVVRHPDLLIAVQRINRREP